jgi:hypothetical protein
MASAAGAVLVVAVAASAVQQLLYLCDAGATAVKSTVVLSRAAVQQ